MKAPPSALGLLALSILYQAGNCASITSSFASQCSAFAVSLSLPNTTVWFTQFVPAGTNLSIPDKDPSCGAPYQLVSTDTCRVAMRVATSDASEISLEAWLPSPDAWTGRFLSAGNGGLAGCVGYPDMAYGTALGFASVGANNGHNGTSGAPFYNAPEVVTDFAWRSVHTGVVVGKELTAQFYGRAHDKSYYLGCSTGGRQGFKSAQAFPEDFDGIVAGAPAFAFNNLSSWSGHFFLLTGKPGSDTYLSPNLWGIVHQDVLAQCDALDGVADGIIEDPDLCNYRPENLICASDASDTSTCLTRKQAATVRGVFSDLYGVGGSLVYPRMQPGSEELARFIYYSGAAFQYTSDWYRYAIYNNPNWDPATLSPADYAFAAAKNPDNIETWEGDLSAVRDRGAKILHYHGLMDAIISSDNSPRYYKHVAKTMGLHSRELDDFYRFFRISGMGHCSGGPGATFIGNQAVSNATLDPNGNVLMAMVRWVEEGIAPEYIEGTAYANETKDSGDVLFKRRHCKYPARNVYVGTGDGSDMEGWKCVPGRRV